MSENQEQFPEDNSDPEQSNSAGFGQAPEQPNSYQYRRVPPANGASWFIQAFYLFKLSPGVWLSSIFVMSIILFIMLLIPFIQYFAIVSAPVFTAGLMVGCQQLKNKQAFSLNHLFSGFEKQFTQLVIIGLIYLGCTVLCSYAAVAISAGLGHPIATFEPEMVSAENVDFKAFEAFMVSLLLPTLIMLALMLPLFMACWFAPALVVFSKIPPVEAMKKSFMACANNTMPFIVYGATGLLLVVFTSIIIATFSAVIPMISFLLSLFSNLMLMSVLFASIFTSFEDIFSQNIGDSNTDGSISIII